MKKTLSLVTFYLLISTSLLAQISKVDSTLKIYADGDYYFQREKYDSALVCYNQAVNNGLRLDFLFFKKGYCEFNSGQYNEAIRDLTASVIKIPFLKMKEGFTTPGHSFVKGGNGVYWSTLNSVSLQYQYFKAYYFRALSKYYLEDFYGCVDDFKKLHKSSGDSSYVSCLYLGKALIRTNKLKESEKYFSFIISQKSNNDLEQSLLGDAYSDRGYLNYRNGLKERACIDWSRGNDLGSDSCFDYLKKYCK